MWVPPKGAYSSSGTEAATETAVILIPVNSVNLNLSLNPLPSHKRHCLFF